MVGGIFLSFILLTSMPTLYKKVKSGASLRTAIKELLSDALKNKGGGYQHNFPTHSVRSGSSYTGTSITDYTTNPLYSSLPGNIYNRY
ncbi:MAG: hypothetical protein ACK5AV_06515 [Alphaproteobacteria bacterium]